MKKVISGKAYNTQTAKVVGSAKNEQGSEVLYRTRRGDYFILESVSRYGVYLDGRDPVERIVPVSQNKAMDWIGIHEPAEPYQAYSDDRNETKESASYSLPAWLIQRLRKYADAHNGGNASALVEAAILEVWGDKLKEM